MEWTDRERERVREEMRSWLSGRAHNMELSLSLSTHTHTQAMAI